MLEGDDVRVPDAGDELRLPAEPAPPPEPLRFAPQISREAFCRMVRRAKEYIAAGDIYQVNLSQRLTAPWRRSGWEFFQRLAAVSPAPFAAKNTFVISSLSSSCLSPVKL